MEIRVGTAGRNPAEGGLFLGGLRERREATPTRALLEGGTMDKVLWVVSGERDGKRWALKSCETPAEAAVVATEYHEEGLWTEIEVNTEADLRGGA